MRLISIFSSIVPRQDDLVHEARSMVWPDAETRGRVADSTTAGFPPVDRSALRATAAVRFEPGAGRPSARTWRRTGDETHPPGNCLTSGCRLPHRFNPRMSDPSNPTRASEAGAAEDVLEDAASGAVVSRNCVNTSTCLLVSPR